MSGIKLWLFGPIATIAAMVSFPQVARPMPCSLGPFIIFFDLNKDEITPQAQPMLDYAVAIYGDCGLSGRITIAGHTDRAGSGLGNLSLSHRRAERVRAYLAIHGLPDEKMIIRSFGESGPLVESPDGVQQALNRRVEITFATW